MKLYLAAYESEDGENLDLLVQAKTPERAAELWYATSVERDWIGEYLFDGAFQEGDPVCGRDEALRIFEVNPGDAEGVLGWDEPNPGGICVLRGYVYP